MRKLALSLILIAIGTVIFARSPAGDGPAGGGGPATADRVQVSPTGPDGADFNFYTTELATEGENFTFQIACVNRTLLPCVLFAGEIEGEPGFIARVADRTNGQLQFELTSFAELGIVGPDTLRLTANGT